MDKNIKIHSGNYHAIINPDNGANIIKLFNSEYNADILCEPGSFDNKFLNGMPALFPANRISNGGFLFEGRKYGFGINEPQTGCFLHGKLYEEAFEVEEQKDNYVKCVYYNNGTKVFPQECKISRSYLLDPGGLTHIAEIENLSQYNMPVILGFHTTFKLPFLADSKKEDIRIKCDVSDYIERNMQTYLPTGNILPEDGITKSLKCGEFAPSENKISRHYRAGNTGIMEIYDLKKQLKIVYENDEKFGWRIIYNASGDGFICLEPQNTMVDCFNSYLNGEFTGCDVIKPHSFIKYYSKISIKGKENKL